MAPAANSVADCAACGAAQFGLIDLIDLDLIPDEMCFGNGFGSFT